MLSVSLLLMLTGCATFGSPKTNTLPPLPSDLRVCFESTVEAPDPGSLSRAEVIRLIAELKRSETLKTFCGKRLIAFYETLL